MKNTELTQEEDKLDWTSIVVWDGALTLKGPHSFQWLENIVLSKVSVLLNKGFLEVAHTLCSDLDSPLVFVEMYPSIHPLDVELFRFSRRKELIEWMSTSIGDILDWLRGCGLSSRTMAVSPWRDPEPNSFSVHKADRLSSSNVTGNWESSWRAAGL